jgi:hypothetical protein
MQKGKPMRLQAAEHPKFSHDLTSAFDYGTGRKIRKDIKGQIAQQHGRSAVEAPKQRLRELANKQKKSKWRYHQSMASSKRGFCSFTGCPGFKACSADCKRSFRTSM